MIYEFRTYHAEPGRLADLLALFRSPIIPIFTRLGFHLIGAWTGTDPGQENDLTYIFAWPSREAREAGFKALNADPEFNAAFPAIKATIASVTKSFMQPADFSPLQ